MNKRTVLGLVLGSNETMCLKVSSIGKVCSSKRKKTLRIANAKQNKKWEPL